MSSGAPGALATWQLGKPGPADVFAYLGGALLSVSVVVAGAFGLRRPFRQGEPARRSLREPAMTERYLSPVEAARVYDRIGRLQDTQGFYERRAVEELLRRGAFERAAAVVEVGCGTGRLAERLLARRLPRDARYLGVDVSPRMVALSRERLAPWRERAEVRLSTGSARIEAPDGTFDRFLACYLVDLLSPAQIAAVLGEARRLLGEDGRLCLVSLAPGASGAARLVTATWERVWRVRPGLVGGCRPVELLRLVGADGWTVEDRLLVCSFAVTSEVLLARPR